MPEATRVVLSEYQSADIPDQQLTEGDLRRLRALQDRRVLILNETRTGWRITAAATVGVIILDRMRLTIQPKLSVQGKQLLAWLCYAMAVPVPHESTTRRWDTGADGYPELVASALLTACDELVRAGLRRDYLRRERVQPVLRGRLDFAAQATRRYGQLDQLHTRTFEREADIWENRVLNTALKTGGRIVADPELARQLHATSLAFPSDSASTAALASLSRAQYTRLNARYRTAHTWARLLLGGGGVTDLFTDTGMSAETLLLRMPILWEQVTSRLVSEVVISRGGRVVRSSGADAIITTGDFGNASAFRPDVLVREHAGKDGEAKWLAVDAKYKTYDRRAIEADDVHQLLTYIAGYSAHTTPSAVIIHPQRGEHARRTLKTIGPSGLVGTIHVVGVDTRATPTQAASWLTGQWAAIQAG